MKRKISHITPGYIYNRAQLAITTTLNPSDPWITNDAIRYLSQMIRPDDIGVEFGSGRSTIWLAKKLKHLTSIENDSNWYSKVKNMIADMGIEKKIKYIKQENGIDYYNTCDLFEENSIDFCLIDGIVRDQCALRMIPKMKSCSLLVIDNIERFISNTHSKSPESIGADVNSMTENWREFRLIVDDWRRYWTTNGVTDTCIWIKP